MDAYSDENREQLELEVNDCLDKREGAFARYMETLLNRAYVLIKKDDTPEAEEEEEEEEEDE